MSWDTISPIIQAIQARSGFANKLPVRQMVVQQNLQRHLEGLRTQAKAYMQAQQAQAEAQAKVATTVDPGAKPVVSPAGVAPVATPAVVASNQGGIPGVRTQGTTPPIDYSRFRGMSLAQIYAALGNPFASYGGGSLPAGWDWAEFARTTGGPNYNQTDSAGRSIGNYADYGAQYANWGQPTPTISPGLSNPANGQRIFNNATPAYQPPEVQHKPANPWDASNAMWNSGGSPGISTAGGGTGIADNPNAQKLTFGY